MDTTNMNEVLEKVKAMDAIAQFVAEKRPEDYIRLHKSGLENKEFYEKIFEIYKEIPKH